MKPIVTDTYDFPTLVGKGYVYVDKTAFLRRMISGVDGRFFFMSRPRRFGKSLMISTLEQIFKGNKKLFRGLAIAKSNYDWKPYPVIRLDMSALDSTVGAQGLGHDLLVVIAEKMRAFGLEVPDVGSPGMLMGLLIDGLKKQSRDAPYAADRRRIVYVGVNYDTLKRNVDTLNDTLNSRMLSLIRQRPGLRRPDLMAALNVSESTVARCLREMRASVEFRGPSKTGGYFIKEGGA